MNLKPSVASRSSHTVDKFTEKVPCTTPKDPLTTNHCRIFGKTDALEAVKLDPAVLEAQVTVDTKHNAADHKTGDNGVTETKEATPSSSFEGFEAMVSQHEAALLSLAPERLELLMAYADLLRRQRMSTRKTTECVFCKNNGKSLYWYTSHTLRDGRGRVQCPVLRAFHCPRCGATGDRAHTIKYCPEPADSDARIP